MQRIMKERRAIDKEERELPRDIHCLFLVFVFFIPTDIMVVFSTLFYFHFSMN